MRYWAYKLTENKKVLAMEGGFECEADAEEAAEGRKNLRFPDKDRLKIRTFQPPYDPDWEKTEKHLREMVADLIEETQRLEEKCQSPRPFLMEWTRLAKRKKYNSFSF